MKEYRQPAASGFYIPKRRAAGPMLPWKCGTPTDGSQTDYFLLSSFAFSLSGTGFSGISPAFCR
ncbi:MAG: hypothetical protein IKV57_03450, partial [Clostridia bacterium]|nr:hypothetical protein [Clostridia bacterium]